MARGDKDRDAGAFRQFVDSEAAGGLVLIGAAALALVVANSPLAVTYFGTLQAKFGPLSLLHWINDALMALFFLLVGLEMKRELIAGQLASWSQRALPGIAAASGMVVPAIIYLAFNVDGGAPRGWAIPAATDIAFALGVLALVGSRVPSSLKLFLLAVAILDDLGAVLIIAAFYTSGISILWLGAAALVGAGLAVLNRRGVTRLLPYLLIGALLWICFLRSGVHPTMAGVTVALSIPLGRGEASALHRLEHALAPWVAFLVVPLFGLANAGVSLSGLGLAALAAPVPLGIAAGLFFGKQIGIFVSAWAAMRFGLARRPEKASLLQIYGVSLLCGIGFTMSLFIGLLAFPDSALLQDEVKVGVLLGSLLSAIAGLGVLIFAAPLRGVASRNAAR
ncbi:MAG TPA: Na+/H+ antiporter NhaA [Sphingomicrobium sp.]|nr:Na+/H+ antiporter NhaA [Sphingomicrobium sp.]